MEESHLNLGVQELISSYMLQDGLDLVVDFDKSRGAYLYDTKRDDYFLDFLAFYATAPVGYNHPRLVNPETLTELGRAAVHKPSNSDIWSREMAAFVDTFARIAKPDFMKYLFFVEGGAPAVENALKTAFDWKTRKNIARGLKQTRGHRVIHFREAFHGRSGYTLSLTNTSDKRKTDYFPKFDWPRILNPKCSFPLEGEHLAKVIQAEAEALGQIRSVLEQSPEEVACLILEPIQGEGGDNHFRVEFHRALREICDEHDLLLIYDEVQTGMGATGRMWASEHYVRPDILVFGKKSQVCGIMVSDRIDDIENHVFRQSGRLNSTWGGNLIDMVRCRIYLELYQGEDLLSQARSLGTLLLEGLQELEAEFPSIFSNPRGIGPLCAIDLPDTGARDSFRQKLFDKKLIILPSGERSLRFRPFLDMPLEDATKGIEIFRQVAGRGSR